MARAAGINPTGWGFESLRAHHEDNMGSREQPIRRKLRSTALIVLGSTIVM